MKSKTDLNGRFFVVENNGDLKIKYSFLCQVTNSIAQFKTRLEAEKFILIQLQSNNK